MMMKFEQNQALEYVALGDSLSVGVGTPLFTKGFVELYERCAEEDLNKRVDVDKFARVGATTEEVLRLLDSSCVQRAIKQADIITITAGGNDLIRAAKNYLQNQDIEVLASSLKTSIINLTAIIQKLDELILECEGSFIVRLTNLYNPFPESELVDRWVKKYNQHLEKLAKKQNVKIADLYSTFKGQEKELLSRDDVHPNYNGYIKIAATLRQLGYEPLSSRDD
jgi:lysophospholipase L1-like esterase